MRNGWKGSEKDLPELPDQKSVRFFREYNLTEYDIAILISDIRIADYFESLIHTGIAPKAAANWINGQLFNDMNALTLDWDHVPVRVEDLADLIQRVERGELNLQTAKSVLSEMIRKGITAAQIIEEKGLVQIHDVQVIKNNDPSGNKRKSQRKWHHTWQVKRPCCNGSLGR